MKKQCVLLGLFGLFSMLYGQAEGECISGTTRLGKSELYPDQMIIWGCSKGEWFALSDEDNALESMRSAAIINRSQKLEDAYPKLATDKPVGATYIGFNKHLLSKSGADTYTILKNWSNIDRYGTSKKLSSEILGKVIYDEDSGDFYIYDSMTPGGYIGSWNRLNNLYPHTITGSYTGTVKPCSYYPSEYRVIGRRCTPTNVCKSSYTGTINVEAVGVGRSRKLAEDDAKKKYDEKYKDARLELWRKEYSSFLCRDYYLQGSTSNAIVDNNGRKGRLMTGYGEHDWSQVINFLRSLNADFDIKDMDAEREWRGVGGAIHNQLKKDMKNGTALGIKTGPSDDNFVVVVWD